MSQRPEQGHPSSPQVRRVDASLRRRNALFALGLLIMCASLITIAIVNSLPSSP